MRFKTSCQFGEAQYVANNHEPGNPANEVIGFWSSAFAETATSIQQVGQLQNLRLAETTGEFDLNF